jgi:hypothetical protein
MRLLQHAGCSVSRKHRLASPVAHSGHVAVYVDKRTRASTRTTPNAGTAADSELVWTRLYQIPRHQLNVARPLELHLDLHQGHSD